MAIQAVSLVVVPRYFVAILRGIILKAATLEMLLPNMAALFALGCFFAVIAMIKTRKAV